MRRRRKSRKNDTPKIAALSVVLACCAGGLGFTAYQTMGVQSPDQYGCYHGIEGGTTTVIVDNSEPRWNTTQALSIQNYFSDAYDTLPFANVLQVFTTEGDRLTTGIPKPSFHVCGQPESAEDLDGINAETGSAGFLRKQKERLFERVMQPELDALISPNAEAHRRQVTQSPIMELIKGVSSHLEYGDKLVLVSDLVQNSESVQACKVKGHLPAFANFRNKSLYQERLKPSSLDGVSVDVLMLQRKGYGRGGFTFCTEDELRRFWEEYWADNGVTNLNMIRVRHGMAGGT